MVKKAICKKCGAIMNLPESYCDLCYDCENEE